MERLKILAFTHKTTDLKQVGRLHLDSENEARVLFALRQLDQVDELMYVSTCNRVEFIISTSQFNSDFLQKFFTVFFEGNSEYAKWAVGNVTVFSGEEAVTHLFEVASSLDSMVVGEREIITQVRNAYEKCSRMKLTGDLIRLLIKNTIETAKRIYTETQIASRPVSVVSLAYRKLKEINVSLDARFIFIGAGVTNSAMAKYLKKHGFKNFAVFNRSLENASRLAEDLNGKSYSLTDLSNYKDGFDVLVTCTGAEHAIITKEIYSSLLSDDTRKKVIIDLAVPNDVHPEVLEAYDINLIAVNNLQEVAKENLREREKELVSCREILSESLQTFYEQLHIRKVELAMSDVPRKVKEIRENAMQAVFARDIESLDEHSREVLEKVMSYMEKKYISVPMKMAREILIKPE